LSLFDPKSREFFLQGALSNHGVMLVHFTGSVKTIQRALESTDRVPRHVALFCPIQGKSEGTQDLWFLRGRKHISWTDRSLRRL